MAAPLVSSLYRSRCSFCNYFHYKNIRLPIKVTRESSNKTTVKNEEKKWVGVVGLEIHAQIKSSSKLFSGASTQYGAGTNSQVSFFDAALPGTMPVLNEGCVKAGILTAFSLNCNINRVSTFDRKHYFYADLPAGYQITQHQRPLATGGQMVYVYRSSQTGKVERRSAGLVQIQLEQDSGKSLHDEEGGVSLIDLNRAGVGLMEIVTKPDFSGGDDAASFVRELRDLLTTIGTCDGKMSEGSLRVDANVSVHEPGKSLGVRTEVKNLNSLRSIRLAVDHEIERQTSVLDAGGVIINETRSFDVEAGATMPMRDKEKILDYRFMPEPNLPPLILHPKSSVTSPSPHAAPIISEEVEAMMKVLPDKIRLHLEETYNLPLLHSMQLVKGDLTTLFETLVTHHGCLPLKCSTVLLNYFRHIKESGRSIKEEVLSDIIHMFSSGEISGSSVNVLIEEVSKMAGDINVRETVELLGLRSVGKDSIMAAMEEVLGKNPKIVKAYKKGKTNQLKILSTKILKKLGGRVNPETVLTFLLERLKD